MFGLKNKKEVWDLRGRSDSITVKNKNPTSTSGPEASSSSSSTPSSNSGGGGFFGFFGDNSSSSSSSGTSSTSLSSSDNDKLTKIESRLDDIFYRFSRLIDRVELLEKKMDRLERRE